MLYMDNVNRIIFWLLIPVLLLSFLLFRILVWQNLSDGGRLSIGLQHQINIDTTTELNCLILGGSNAVFSLSAEQISDDTELTCYNLSLLNEGYAFPSYWNFVDSLTFDKDSIKHIFYSSVLPLHNDEYYYEKENNAGSGIGIEGDQSFTLIGRSLASYLANLLSGEDFFKSAKSYPLPNRYGDFDFSKYTCEYNNIGNEYGSLYWQDHDLLSGWTISQLNEMRALFENANLYFLLPSVLYGDNFEDSENMKMINEMQDAILYFDNLPNKVVLNVQPAYNDLGVICDAPHHGNQIGREIRTKDLIESL